MEGPLDDSVKMRQRLPFRMRLFGIAMLALLLSLAGGCRLSDVFSGSSDSGTTSSTTATPTGTAVSTVSGTFVDDPVQGLHYASGTLSGTTDGTGAFQCVRGEAVTFSIGDITLGSTRCASVVTPLDLVPGADGSNPLVQAIAGFLQSMDGDGDPGNGVVAISPEVRTWIARTMVDRNLGPLKLTSMSPDDITTFSRAVVTLSRSDQSASHQLTYVPPEEAAANLEVGMAKQGVFRKNVTGTRGLDTDNVSLEVMDDVRTAPRRADGGDPSICDGEGHCITPDTVNPLLAFYVEPAGNKALAQPFWGNDDAWVAVSMDDGATWKRTDLSLSANQAVPVGDDPYADVNRIRGVAEGNEVLVTWISTYCPSSNPMDLTPVSGDPSADPPVPAADLAAMTPADIRAPGVYNTWDIYDVAGAQGAVDYTDPSNPPMMYRPEAGRVAYHCVWAARGVFDGATGGITWYAPEQITSGVRDANMAVPAAATSPDGGKGAFAIIWQEDPLGLNPGMGAGEGVGWGGAHTNKGTDIWYTAIDMGCFAQTGQVAATGSCHSAAGSAFIAGGRPVPAYRMSAPVPLSDDGPCVQGAAGWNAPYCQVLADAFGTMSQTKGKTTTVFARGGEDNPMCAVKNIELSPYWSNPGWPAGMGTLEDQCDNYDPEVNSVPLDGDTAASRPYLQMVYDESIGGMRAVLTYEEQKAMGFLCKGNANCQADRLDYQGKFVLFNSFPAEQPVTVDSGGMLDTLTTTYMDTNQDGVGDSVRMASDGTAFRYIFENARNGRLFVQDASNGAYSGGRVGSRDLRMVVLYKQGLYNMSQTSDLMLRRACGGYAYRDWGSCARTEAASQGVDRDPACISCETVTKAEPGSVRDHTECSACHASGASFTTSDSAITAKPLDWRYVYNSLTDNNLYMDPATGISKSASSYDPLDDVESPWADLAGDMLVVSYAQTPNWPASHHYKATSVFFVRRSFDGGFSWTDAAASREEGPVNLSNLPASEIVEEPRVVVPEDCGFNAGTGTFSCPDAYGSIRATDTIPLVATYCTGENVPRVVTEADIGQTVDATGLDCYFAVSQDLGETYANMRDTNGNGSKVARLAVDHDLARGADPCTGDDSGGSDGSGAANVGFSAAGQASGAGNSGCQIEEGFDWLAHGDAQMLDLGAEVVPSTDPGYAYTLHSLWLQEGTLTTAAPYDGTDSWYRRVDFGPTTGAAAGPSFTTGTPGSR